MKTRITEGNKTNKRYVDYLSDDGKRKALSDGVDTWILYEGYKRRALTSNLERVKRFIETGDWF